MGTIVESRFQNGVGVPGNNISNNSVSYAPSQAPKQSNNAYLVIAIIVAGLELIIIGILLVMAFSHEEKVCTIDDIAKEVEKDDSPSENWKIYEDFMFDVQEEPLKVFAEVEVNGEPSVSSMEKLKNWSEGYVEKFGGETMDDLTGIKKDDAFMAIGDNGAVWRLTGETDDKCMRFDFTEDFQFLEKYSLMAGSCDELD